MKNTAKTTANNKTSAEAANHVAFADRPNTRIVCTENLTFHTLVVYAYASVETCKDLLDTLFKDPVASATLSEKDPKDAQAKGDSWFQSAPDELGGKEGVGLCLIWMNNRYPLLHTIPTCIHEMVHLAAETVKCASVVDVDRGAQSCLVRNEAAKVLRELYGLDIPPESRMDKLEEWLKPREPRRPRGARH